ncbi:hypothetical protein RKD30_005385 [Streptomyces pristinaespiralis]
MLFGARQGRNLCRVHQARCVRTGSRSVDAAAGEHRAAASRP